MTFKKTENVRRLKVIIMKFLYSVNIILIVLFFRLNGGWHMELEKKNRVGDSYSTI